MELLVDWGVVAREEERVVGREEKVGTVDTVDRRMQVHCGRRRGAHVDDVGSPDHSLYGCLVAQFWLLSSFVHMESPKPCTVKYPVGCCTERDHSPCTLLTVWDFLVYRLHTYKRGNVHDCKTQTAPMHSTSIFRSQSFDC